MHLWSEVRTCFLFSLLFDIYLFHYHPSEGIENFSPSQGLTKITKIQDLSLLGLHGVRDSQARDGTRNPTRNAPALQISFSRGRQVLGAFSSCVSWSFLHCYLQKNRTATSCALRGEFQSKAFYLKCVIFVSQVEKKQPFSIDRGTSFYFNRHATLASSQQ